MSEFDQYGNLIDPIANPPHPVAGDAKSARSLARENRVAAVETSLNQLAGRLDAMLEFLMERLPPPPSDPPISTHVDTGAGDNQNVPRRGAGDDLEVPVSQHHHSACLASMPQPHCAPTPESADTLQLMTLTDTASAVPLLYVASRAELSPQPSGRADAAQHGSKLPTVPIEHLPVPVPAAPPYLALANVHRAQAITEPPMIKPLGHCAAASLPAAYPPSTVVACLFIHIMSAAHRRAKHTHVAYSSLQAIPRMRPSPWPPPQC